MVFGFFRPSLILFQPCSPIFERDSGKPPPHPPLISLSLSLSLSYIFHQLSTYINPQYNQKRVYNASKAAVIQLGRNLAAEWGEHGIRVNTISPGYIVTDMVRALFDRFPEREVEWPRQNMLGKLSAPEDYRGAAVFLLSDASRFMTGADLRIDGGHSAW